MLTLIFSFPLASALKQRYITLLFIFILELSDLQSSTKKILRIHELFENPLSFCRDMTVFPHDCACYNDSHTNLF